MTCNARMKACKSCAGFEIHTHTIKAIAQCCTYNVMRRLNSGGFWGKRGLPAFFLSKKLNEVRQSSDLDSNCLRCSTFNPLSENPGSSTDRYK